MSCTDTDTDNSRYLLHQQAPLAGAEVVFVPLPFEDSGSYLGGTAQAPEAIFPARHAHLRR